MVTALAAFVSILWGSEKCAPFLGTITQELHRTSDADRLLHDLLGGSQNRLVAGLFFGRLLARGLRILAGEDPREYCP